jgi:flagellar basal-body rod modification protein FlgD
MATAPISSSPQPSTSATDRNDALRDLDMDQFLKLMITELQNQDPLNPLENAEILQQISQIREIGATGQLTETLQAVLLGQNLTSATSMIGKTVQALSDDAKNVSGTVGKVTVANGDVRLHIGDSAVRLSNVREVVSAPTPSANAASKDESEVPVTLSTGPTIPEFAQ